MSGARTRSWSVSTAWPTIALSCSGGVGIALGYGVDSGSVNAVVLTVAGFPTDCKAGQRIAWKMAAEVTGLTIVSVNAIPAKYLKRNGAQLATGILKANDWVEAIYDVTGFQLLGNDAWIASPETTMSASGTGATLISITHNLGVTPSRVRVVAVCRKVGGVLGYTEGSEVDMDSFLETRSFANRPTFTAWANASVVEIIQPAVASVASWGVVRAGTPWDLAAITPSEWAAKVYYAP